ncbi:TPA: hypothetical protein NNM78_002257 [Pseudomonas aeruginosa]|nr:hypothetical protein [Pseudomonas aeruginosa]
MANVFLVMATAILTKPPIPLRVFQDRGQAEHWQAEVIAYHISPPEPPAGDDAGSWKEYDVQKAAWRSAHPAGIEASHYQRFGVYEVPAELNEKDVCNEDS